MKQCFSLYAQFISGVTNYVLRLSTVLLIYFQQASTGSVRFVVFDDSVTPSLQRLVHAFIASHVDTRHTRAIP